jgi:acyl-CoA synthetase (NDP forming)
MDIAGIRQLIASVRQDGRLVFLETEGLALLRLMGLETPRHVVIRNADEAATWLEGTLPGRRVVVKVQSPEILHKSEVGGVRVVPNERGAIVTTIADMQDRLSGLGVVNFTVNEMVEHDGGLGHELLVGMRWTQDVGPIVTCGAGGIYAEFLASNIRSGRNLAILSPDLAEPDALPSSLRGIAVADLVTGSWRGQSPRLAMQTLTRTVQAFLSVAGALREELAEFEVNPFALTPDGRLVALDALVKLRAPCNQEAQGDRPVWKLKYLLEPRSAAIMGVSERINPGHIIVNNLIREGFDRRRIHIVKPGSASIEGCACVPDIASVPERVDLFVLCIDAAQAAGALVEIIETRKAESVVLIPGGLEEKSGSEQIVARMRDVLADARRSDWRGPLINGGNCLGIRSRPGHYDTTFIPEYKLPVPSGPVSPVAFISQSGAFAVSKASKLGLLNPKYSVTLGNQMDLTVGDYLAYLQDDTGIDLFAVYVEGFRPLDGLKFLRAARDIVASGRTVVLYRAGRTAAGARASASHTASIAGDYAVMRSLARAAGVVVADTIEDFEDLTLLFSQLRDVKVSGWRLGAVSNAGFECVAIADNLGEFTLGTFSASSERRVAQIFARARLEQVVDVHNPLDLTPMMSDEPFADIVEMLLADEGMDAVCVGCVPLTSALATLSPGAGHQEDFSGEQSLGRRLGALRPTTRKPWIAVVDAGALYDPMARDLAAHGVPTFRSADRALRLLNLFCAQRLRRVPRVTDASDLIDRRDVPSATR